MGVNTLAGTDDFGAIYEPGLGLSLKGLKNKLKPPPVVRKIAKAVVKPVAKVAANIIPGGTVVKTVASFVPGIAKPKAKKAPPPAPTPVVAPTGVTAVGTKSTQVQRRMSAGTNRPGKKPPLTTPAKSKARQRPAGLTPVNAAVSPSIMPQEPAVVVNAGLSKKLTDTKKKVGLAKKVTDKVAELRDRQRKFSEASRRASTNAKTLEKRAKAMADAGVPGAAEVARQAAAAANVATQTAAVAESAGAAVSAATTAGIAAGATGSEGTGVLASGIVGFVKEQPVLSAAIGVGAAYVLYRAVKAA